MKHNRYFDDKVQSLGFSDRRGEVSVGVIEPGEYSFGTLSSERITVVAGALWYRIPAKPWLCAEAGEGFSVPAAVTFEVKTEAPVAYLCRYGEPLDGDDSSSSVRGGRGGAGRRDGGAA
jgi:purine/pyrimidine-nucleoside phosphorylase